MKIICVGRNYVAHAKELNNEIPDEPVLFMKPDSALLRNNDPFYIPDWSADVHYEVELIVRIMKLGKNIEKKFAHRYYKEIGLGIDFTARDVQNSLKDKGLPWEKAKAFDSSAVVCPEFVKIESLPDRNAIQFRLDINGKTVQDGNSALMIFPIDDIITHVSKYFMLKIGDLIFTGTPAGVGPVKIGDRLEGYLEGEKKFDFGLNNWSDLIFTPDCWNWNSIGFCSLTIINKSSFYFKNKKLFLNPISLKYKRLFYSFIS